MNEAAVRELVREALGRTELQAALRESRHLAQPAAPDAQPRRTAPHHPSHALYAQLVNATDACLIEPAVPCNHCGYCKSHGH